MRRDKTCYCGTCKKLFHFMGIASHRAMHRRKKEKVFIRYTKKWFEHDFRE